MMRIGFRRIRHGKEKRLRAWFAELKQRRDEVLETFRDETVRHEQAWILETREGPVLVYAVEAEDLEQAYRAAGSSTHPIDAEHRAVLKECLGERADPPPIHDLRADPE